MLMPSFLYLQSHLSCCHLVLLFFKNKSRCFSNWTSFHSSTLLLIVSYCSNEAFDPNVAEEVGWTTMTTYWPDVEYQETDPDYDDFWIHEWDKHGTCRLEGREEEMLRTCLDILFTPLSWLYD